MEKKREKSEFSYQQAIARIEAILEKLQSGQPDIDTLAADVKQATELIRQCRQRLLKTEKEVEQILGGGE